MSVEKSEETAAREKVNMPHRGGGKTLYIAAAVAVAIIVLVAVFATGLLSSGSNEKVTLTGAGATFPMPLILKWAEEYNTYTESRVQVNYGGGGSGAGITQIKEKTVVFAGSDAPLSASDSETFGLLHIPETIGSVVVAYNLPGVTSLRLDGETVARIFMGNITMWNDSEIADLNPTVTLPDEAIQTVTRSDSSGTTFVFSGYLEIVSAEFEQLYGQSKTVAWPDSIAAVGNSGVASEIMSQDYRIGYTELAYAEQNSLTHAAILNGDGTGYVTASIATTSAAAAGAALPAGDGDWSNTNILNQPGTDAYPIATFTYILVYEDLDVYGDDLNKTAAEDLIDFLWWCVHDGQDYSADLYYAPLPSSVVELNENTLGMVIYHGDVVRQ